MLQKVIWIGKRRPRYCPITTKHLCEAIAELDSNVSEVVAKSSGVVIARVQKLIDTALSDAIIQKTGGLTLGAGANFDLEFADSGFNDTPDIRLYRDDDGDVQDCTDLSVSQVTTAGCKISNSAGASRDVVWVATGVKTG